MFTGKMSGYPGEQIECTVDGILLVATVYADQEHGAPWEEEDGHGPVSGWKRRDKRAGEMILCEDNGSKRYYDFAKACRIARKDGWGVDGGRQEGESAAAYAARAAMADYERLRRWCADDWQYVGVGVMAFFEDGEERIALTQEYSHAIWGIESDCGEYLVEVANEELPGCLEEAKERLERMALASQAK